MRYVVYEVWTRARVIEAATDAEAYQRAEPIPVEGFTLCNWHVVPVVAPRLRPVGVQRLEMTPARSRS